MVTATTLVKSGGTSSQFLKADGTVDSSTYLTSYTETDPIVGAINGIVKADGAGNISAASAGTDYLTPSGDGSSLTGIGTAFTNVQATWSLGANGTSAYRFTGPGNDGTEDNPDIYLVRGQKYRFTNNTGGSHPFEIRSSAGGSAYSDGVTNNNAASGNIEINVQHDAPARLFYQCSSHSAMVGNIYVVGGSDWRMTDVNTSTDPEIYTDRYVGIGTDNPGAKLEVFDETANTILNVKSGDAGAVINLIDPSQRSSIEQNGTTLKIISDTGAEFASSDIRLQVDGATKMRVQSTGNIAIDNGNLVFSTSGTGIDFSATSDSGGMTSELLDDYEEGTWTPGISGRTVTASEGTYTKIGRQVLLRFLLAGIDSSLTSGDVNINGIPYTSANLNQNGACLICDSSGVSYATNFGDIYGRVNGNSTTIQLLQKRTDGSSHDWFGAGGGLSTGVVLRGYAWYTT